MIRSCGVLRAAPAPSAAAAAAATAALAIALTAAAPLGAQSAAGVRAPERDALLRAERVEEVLRWLAADERAGRDSPSPALTEAARYIEAAFRDTGLDPGAADASFSHRYTLRGVAFDAAGVEIELLGDEADRPARALRPGDDVRVWSSGRPFQSDRETCRIRALADFGGRALSRSRQPTLAIVPVDSVLWRQARGVRSVLTRGVPGGAPTLLVREGLLEHDAERVEARLRIPAPEQVDVELENIVGVLKGGDLGDQWVLVTAHYDHVGIRPGPGTDYVYNGADDNATGTTGVVVLGEALARRAARGEKLRRSVMFVAFSAEEKGLRGSRAFVADPPVPLDSIVAVVNLEMLGRPPNDAQRKAWVTGRDLSDFEAIAEPVLARNGIELIDFPMQSGLFRASDNWPFATEGVVAHSVSAGTLHQDYHRPGDEADRIDVGHMTAVLRGVHDLVVELASRDGRPAWNERGRAAIQSRRRR